MAVSEQKAALVLATFFAATWDKKHLKISRSWHAHWPNLITLFDYQPPIHKGIYTTHAIESLNSVIRKSVKT